MNSANINSIIMINRAQELLISFEPASGASVNPASQNGAGQHKRLYRGGDMRMRTIGVGAFFRSPWKETLVCE